jgi:hypothetical protein
MGFILLYWVEIWFICDTQRDLLFVAFCSENLRPADDSRRHDDDTQNLIGNLIYLCLMYSIHLVVVYLKISVQNAHHIPLFQIKKESKFSPIHVM